jgi:hypothetical protein
VSATARATGIARSTIDRRIAELCACGNGIGTATRRPGGGRKPAIVHQPGLPAALEVLIEDAIRGDPCSPLRWVSRSQRHLAKALIAQGFKSASGWWDETAVKMAGSHLSRSIEAAMSVIAIQTEPHRVNATADPLNQRHIEVAIEHSIALAEPEDDAPEFLTPHEEATNRFDRTSERSNFKHPIWR